MQQALSEKGFYTVEEYLAFERSSELKHEYISGEIVAMAGATRAHNLVTGNIAQRLRNQLGGKPCETYSSEMRVRTTPTEYTYPDVVVVCDEPQFEDAELDTLLNPTVVVEVLSKSSEARDRGEKFLDYRGIESVKDIILITQHKMRVEHYVRQPNNDWILHDISDPDGMTIMTSIGCTLTLAEIYERVTFPPPRQLKSVTSEAQGEGESGSQ
jgi:Uma2 family endonuclease